MKIDHLVANVGEQYQKKGDIIKDINDTKLEYVPRYGKGNKGFKVSNIWIGDEYFELVHILNKDGGGWVPEWTRHYHEGQRGLICLMFDVTDLDKLYAHVQACQINISKPKWLEFKWFFNLLTRKMPWRNSYAPFFEYVPLQLGFQEMKDQKARDFMAKYMQPNSKEHGVDGIKTISIYGEFTKKDFNMLDLIFKERIEHVQEGRVIHLKNEQKVYFLQSDVYKVEVNTTSNFLLATVIENIEIHT